MVSDKKNITELTDILDQDIETIVALHMNAERKVGVHQRFIEKTTNTLGRPLAVYLIMLLILLWIILNVSNHFLGLSLFDAPPFPWLQDIVSIRPYSGSEKASLEISPEREASQLHITPTGIESLSALVMTMIVLTTQNRQGKLAEQRRHLDLQITLLTERKVSKIIELLEDLRYDIPSVKNRIDPEAEVMKEPVDPHTALLALNQTLQEAAKEYKLELEIE